MAYSFDLQKPENIDTFLERASTKIALSGGKLSGNTQEGRIYVKGAEGTYYVTADKIKITILKKPSILFPYKVIETKVREMFGKLV